jgi:MFS family permease
MALIAYLTGHGTWANSFHHRDFRLLWGSTLIHSVGRGMEQVSLGWLVLEITDSPFMVGVSYAALMAPFFFLGILSGTVADRVDRRVALRIITLGAVIVAGLMAAVLLTNDISECGRLARPLDRHTRTTS